MGEGRKLTLSKGDTVAVVATGFAVRRAPFERGLAAIERMGFDTAVGEHVLDRDGYLAGGDADRLADLNAAIADPEVGAVWFARGGYGTARLLDEVDWAGLARSPKLLIGYSDLTALFCAALRGRPQRCLYGPVVTEIGERGAYHRPSLRALLAGEGYELRIARRQVLAPGRAEGRLVGGNLSVLAHLCGTRYLPDLAGSVLFLEEIGEETYRIDRMLTQLRQSGLLAGLAGVLLGSVAVPPRRRFPPDRALEEVLREALGSLGVPVVIDLPAGHRRAKRTLPLGGRVSIDTERRHIGLEP